MPNTLGGNSFLKRSGRYKLGFMPSLAERISMNVTKGYNKTVKLSLTDKKQIEYVKE